MTDLDARCFHKETVANRTVLVASDIMADEWLAKQPFKKPMAMTGRRPRNWKHLAKLWCLLDEVVSNCDMWPNKEQLLIDLKEATGLSQTRINPFTGRQMVIVGSIAFESMDQDTFAEWYEKAINTLATDVLQCAPADLQARIIDRLGEDWQAKPRRR